MFVVHLVYGAETFKYTSKNSFYIFSIFKHFNKFHFFIDSIAVIKFSSKLSLNITLNFNYFNDDSFSWIAYDAIQMAMDDQ